MGSLPAEDAHVKRSQLINTFLQERRAIEKELRKKKIPAKHRESLEARLEALSEEHKQQLASFDEEQGTGKATRLEVTSEKKVEGVDETTTCVLDERKWGSLSKRELEEACGQRHLSQKGTKEDLVSRLTIYTLDLKSKQARDNTDETAQEAVSEVEAATPAAVTRPIKYEQPQGPSTKQDYRNKNKKLWKRKGAARTAADRHASSSSGSETPSDTAEEVQVVDEERQKQLKRELILQNVLTSIVKKYNKGIAVSEIPNYLEKFKVVNFAPSALGYNTVEEWIINQPKDILHVDRKSWLVFPPRIGEMPSSSCEEDDSASNDDSDSGRGSLSEESTPRID